MTMQSVGRVTRPEAVTDAADSVSTVSALRTRVMTKLLFVIRCETSVVSSLNFARIIYAWHAGQNGGSPKGSSSSSICLTKAIRSAGGIT